MLKTDLLFWFFFFPLLFSPALFSHPTSPVPSRKCMVWLNVGRTLWLVSFSLFFLYSSLLVQSLCFTPAVHVLFFFSFPPLLVQHPL